MLRDGARTIARRNSRLPRINFQNVLSAASAVASCCVVVSPVEHTRVVTLRGAIFISGVLVCVAGAALAQSAPGTRIGQPQALSPWDASTPQAPANRPAVDPFQTFPATPGITVNGVTFFPGVTAGAFYDDNVFATNGNRQGSWGEVVRPELAVRTQGSNYAVEAGAYAERIWYNRFGSEDQTNAGAAIASTVMPDPDTQLVGKLRYVRAHEARGSGESLFSTFDKPVA